MNRCGHMDYPDGHALSTGLTRDGFPHVGFVQWRIPFLGVGQKLIFSSLYQLYCGRRMRSANCEPSDHDNDLSWHLS